MMDYDNINLNEIQTVEVKKVIGLYFLYRGIELVYIGNTINVFKRITDHIATKEFDSYKFVEIPGNIDLNNLEEYYIKKHKPRYNIQFNIDNQLPRVKSVSPFENINILTNK